MDEHYLSRVFPSSLQVAKLTAVSLNSEGPLERQREFSLILLMRKLRPEWGKIFVTCMCVCICLFLHTCVRRALGAPAALDLTHSCDAWREMFQLTAHVWSHSDLAKYTAVRSLCCSSWNQRAAEKCGCSSLSAPPFPSSPVSPGGRKSDGKLVGEFSWRS